MKFYKVEGGQICWIYPRNLLRPFTNVKHAYCSFELGQSLLSSRWWGDGSSCTTPSSTYSLRSLLFFLTCLHPYFKRCACYPLVHPRRASIPMSLYPHWACLSPWFCSGIAWWAWWEDCFQNQYFLDFRACLETYWDWHIYQDRAQAHYPPPLWRFLLLPYPYLFYVLELRIILCSSIGEFSN